jgi:phosphoenolpyruvate synthase/pyruvate phosphate dikinase
MSSTTQTALLWLDDPSAADVSLVGGKAANLCRLAVRHPVPPGFCVTAGAFAEFSIAEPDFGNATASPVLRALIAEAYEELGTRLGCVDPSVAVRSSGVDEDGAQSSFAGQFDTYLNVTGVDRLCAAIEACWASALNQRVLAYREHHQLQSSGGVAVLVQALVPADTAAVVFSANPVTGDRGEVVVNASFGLGESIVGGTVTPDTYVVRRDGLSLARTDIAQKRRMTVRTSDGIREVEVPRFLQMEQALTGDQIREVARMAVDLEAAMGWPVDVECAYAKDDLYLLQCRPITTLRSDVDYGSSSTSPSG